MGPLYQAWQSFHLGNNPDTTLQESRVFRPRLFAAVCDKEFCFQYDHTLADNAPDAPNALDISSNLLHQNKRVE